MKKKTIWKAKWYQLLLWHSKCVCKNKCGPYNHHSYNEFISWRGFIIMQCYTSQHYHINFKLICDCTVTFQFLFLCTILCTAKKGMSHYDPDIKMNIQYEIHKKTWLGTWNQVKTKQMLTLSHSTPHHTTPCHATPRHLLTPHEASHAE